MTVKKKRPNVVIFLMDCVRSDHLSSYGYGVRTTPNIDRVRGEGVLFKNMIATSGWTLPTHSSLFTGLYPSIHGASKEHLYLDDTYPTMASVLRDNGYSTSCFSSVGYVSRETGLDRGFDAFEESFEKEGSTSRFDKYKLKYKALRLLSLASSSAKKDIIPGKITNWKVRDWYKGKREKDKPFFMFIHYIDAHKPYIYKQHYHEMFLKDKDKLAKGIEMSNYGWPEYTLRVGELDDDVINALYDSKIYSIDYCIQEVMDMIRDAGEYDNTVFVFTADHGEILTTIFDHHFYITDEVLKIPLLIRYPEAFEPGSTRDDLASTVDIMPTVLDIAGIEWKSTLDHIQGISLLEPNGGERYVVAERGKMNDPWLKKKPELNNVAGHPPFDCTQKAVRTSEYKYIWTSDGTEELYHIATDENETKNIVKEKADIAARLKAKLLEIVGSSGERTDQAKSTEIEEKLKKSLESLGYM